MGDAMNGENVLYVAINHSPDQPAVLFLIQFEY